MASPSEQNTVYIGQCLFGYDGGHRLLSSSADLSQDDLSNLLLLSDLAPGVDIVPDHPGYWTAFPLEKAKKYVIMKTWIAFEMSRPGCVWSHALFVDFSEIGRFKDMAAFQRLAKRPTVNSYQEYSTPIAIRIDHESISIDKPKYSMEQISRVLRAIYAQEKSRIAVGTIDESWGNLVFSIWSQQWPRLRRSFSFRTAGSVPDTGSKLFKFQIVTKQAYAVSKIEMDPLSPAAWEQAVIDDLLNPTASDLRPFLWRYGADTLDGQSAFKPLTELFLLSRDKFSKNNLASLLQKIYFSFPGNYEAQILKEDLVAFPPNKYSLVPSAAPWDAFEILLSKTNHQHEVPIDVLTQMLKEVWQKYPDRVLESLERVEDQESIGPLIQALNSIASDEQLNKALSTNPKLKIKLLALRPALMASEEFLSQPTSDILEVLKSIPLDEKSLSQILPVLFLVDNHRVSSFLYDQFTLAVTQAVAKAVDEGNPDLSRSWIKVAITNNCTNFIRYGLNEGKSYSSLATYAKLLDYDTRGVIEVGPQPWSRAMETASENISGDEKSVFFAFLLSLAIANPRPGTEIIFETAFESIHADLGKVSLPYEAYKILSRHLPQVHWWLHWDKCLRLRTAVVKAYEVGKLSRASFKKLAKDDELTRTMNEMYKNR